MVNFDIHRFFPPFISVLKTSGRNYPVTRKIKWINFPASRIDKWVEQHQVDVYKHRPLNATLAVWSLIQDIPSPNFFPRLCFTPKESRNSWKIQSGGTLENSFNTEKMPPDSQLFFLHFFPPYILPLTSFNAAFWKLTFPLSRQFHHIVLRLRVDNKRRRNNIIPTTPSTRQNVVLRITCLGG